MRVLSIIAFFAMIATFGCTSKKHCETTEDTQKSICGKWELSKINDKEIDSTDAYVMFNMSDSTVAAFDGCNNIGGFVVKADSGNIVMVDMSSTLQFCPDQDESAMLGAILSVVNRYEIKECAEQGEFLIITSEADSISATLKKVVE